MAILKIIFGGVSFVPQSSYDAVNSQLQEIESKNLVGKKAYLKKTPQYLYFLEDTNGFKLVNGQEVGNATDPNQPQPPFEIVAQVDATAINFEPGVIVKLGSLNRLAFIPKSDIKSIN